MCSIIFSSSVASLILRAGLRAPPAPVCARAAADMVSDVGAGGAPAASTGRSRPPRACQASPGRLRTAEPVAASCANLSQGAREGGLNRGCGAQLAFVPFLIGMIEVGSAQGRPSCPSTAAAAHFRPESRPESPARGSNSAIFHVLVPFAGWTEFHCNGLREFRVGDGANQPFDRRARAPHPPGADYRGALAGSRPSSGAQLSGRRGSMNEIMY